MRNIASFSLLLLIVVGALFIWNSKAVAPQKDLPVPTATDTLKPSIIVDTLMPSPVVSPSITVSPIPSNSSYSCPTSEYIDCMPIVAPSRKWMCEETYLKWAQENCPNFKGVAY